MFGRHETFSFSNGSGFGKNGIIFGGYMSSPVHVDNKKKDILILGKGPTDGLDDTTITAEKEYPINFTEHNRKFCLSFHYNGENTFISLLMVLKSTNLWQKTLKLFF